MARKSPIESGIRLQAKCGANRINVRHELRFTMWDTYTYDEKAQETPVNTNAVDRLFAVIRQAIKSNHSPDDVLTCNGCQPHWARDEKHLCGRKRANSPYQLLRAKGDCKQQVSHSTLR